MPYDTYIPFYCNVLSSLVSHTGKGKNKKFIFKFSNFYMRFLTLKYSSFYILQFHS